MTRRRLLGGIVTIGGAGTAVGAGTMAAFNDSETSTGNIIEAGTLDLTHDGESPTITLFEDASNIVPGDSDSDSITLANAGSIKGTMEIGLDEIRNYENTRYQAEEDQGDMSDDEGELQDYLEVQAFIDGEPLMDPTRVGNLPYPSTYTTNVTLSQDESVNFRIDWEFIAPSPPNHKEVNVAQSDRIEVDVSFHLVQTKSV